MKPVELAMRAGRARQSPQTGFVHHSYESPERGSETIPVYENFCFALALFRTKIAENVLEAKTLLERLFAFQTTSGFPVYLHEFPHCKSHALSKKLSIVAQFLIRDFLRSKLKALIQPPEEHKDWADFLIQSQLTGENPAPALEWWDGRALCFTGPQKQERGEPAVTLFDLIMGEWTSHTPARALIDHPIHIQASLIYPKTVLPMPSRQNWSRRFWGTGNPTHSALLHTQGLVTQEGDTIIIDLPEKEVHDEVEISYFVSRCPGAQFLVGGLQSTSFQPEEPIAVASGGLSFEVTFSILEGDGRFWGHLHLANRPGQIGCKGDLKHEAFDRSIALRTIQRTQAARIKMTFRQQNG
jgi:hypothetical protein